MSLGAQLGSVVLSFAWTAVLSGWSAAQSPCLQWSDGFGAFGIDAPGNVSVYDQVVFDNGSGPALYVCGIFESAGNVPVTGIAKWDGQRFSAPITSIGSTSIGATPNALAIYDDGTGTKLYVGGVFSSIDGVSARNLACWDGVIWKEVGGGYGRPVTDLIAFDDGTGPQLYIAGSAYASLSGSYGSVLARWNGSTWSTPGGIEPWPKPNALTIYDDGSGDALYVGGEINSLGAQTVHNLLRWDGASLTEVSGGVNGIVESLAVHDDGGGDALYVGGLFTAAGGAAGFNRIARWKNSTWSPLAGGLGGTTKDVYALASYYDGVSRQLYAGGEFTTANGLTANQIARWDGTSWTALGNPPGMASSYDPETVVRSLAVLDDGSGAGESLYVGGTFESAGGTRADNFARWNASGWSPLWTSSSTNGSVEVMAEFDSAAGPELYAAGGLTYAGATAVPWIAKWNGASWSTAGALGSIYGYSSLGGVHAFQKFDDGTGEAFYAGGRFLTFGGLSNSIARWDGLQWSMLGSNLQFNGMIRAMTIFDDGSGPALWVAGDFTSIGAMPAKRFARWDGSSWFAPAIGPGNTVNSLAVYDNGSGPALFATGAFAKLGGVYFNWIARWDGANWSPLGTGLGATGNVLRVFDDGSGEKLYVGGAFTNVPATSPHIARWDGTNWEPVGAGLSQSVTALEIFDDGRGPALYAASGGVARWNGATWDTVFDPHGSGAALSLHTSRVGSTGGTRLLVGGSFTVTGSVGSSNFAVLERQGPCPPTTYCSAGTSSNGCVPSIGAVGTPSASASGSFVITASHVESQKLGLIFYGVAGRTATPWGSTTSMLCVRPPQQRMTQSNSGGTTGTCDGVLAVDWNAFVGSHPAALGAPFQAGELVYAQGWYRDPPSPKTTALTDALEFVTGP